MSSRTGRQTGAERDLLLHAPFTAEPHVAGMAFTLHTGHKPGGLRQRGWLFYIFDKPLFDLVKSKFAGAYRNNHGVFFVLISCNI